MFHTYKDITFKSCFSQKPFQIWVLVFTFYNIRVLENLSHYFICYKNC